MNEQHVEGAIVNNMPRRIKVAVVGTGLAGLTAGHLLTRKCYGDDVEFEVHLFEKAPSIGMESSSVSLAPRAGDSQWRIDVPMRSFQGGYYRNLIALYRSLGVQFRQADFSYSFSSLSFPATRREARAITTSMIYNGASGRRGVSKPASLHAESEPRGAGVAPGLSAQLWSSIVFVYMTLQVIMCYVITLFHSLPFWRAADVPNTTFGQWALKATPTGYLARIAGMDTAWRTYVQTVLIPLVSAMCTAPLAVVMNHPLEEILDFVWLTFGTHHYVVVGGVRKVVENLTKNVEHLHLSSTIMSIDPDPSNPSCVTIRSLANGVSEEHTGFHHVVLATQAPNALSILRTYDSALGPDFVHRKKELGKLLTCLASFHCLPTMVVNHTDGSLLPDDSKDVRDLNLITSASDTVTQSRLQLEKGSKACMSPSYTMATHVQTPPTGVPGDQPRVYQTTNPIVPPRKDSVLSVATLDRAFVTMESKKALQLLCTEDRRKWWQCPYEADTRLGELQGALPGTEPSAPGIWICGSYAHLGVPLLEGCVVSARNVIEQGILKREGISWSQAPW